MQSCLFARLILRNPKSCVPLFTFWQCCHCSKKVEAEVSASGDSEGELFVKLLIVSDVYMVCQKWLQVLVRRSVWCFGRFIEEFDDDVWRQELDDGACSWQLAVTRHRFVSACT